jgi:hypothetical protein
MVEALASREVRVSRELVVVPGDDPPGQYERLTDSLHAADSQEPAFPEADAVLLPSYGLRDISLGGASLALSPTDPPEDLSQRLVRLAIALPRLGATDPGGQFRLQILGAVRRDRAVSDVRTLHVRFVARLPVELEVVLTRLEQQALTNAPS